MKRDIVHTESEPSEEHTLPSSIGRTSAFHAEKESSILSGSAKRHPYNPFNRLGLMSERSRILLMHGRLGMEIKVKHPVYINLGSIV